MKNLKFKSKQVFILCWAIILVLFNLVGCKNDGEIVSNNQDNGGNNGKTKAMGKYIEKDIALPEGETMDTVLSLQKNADGKLILFTRDLSNQYAVYYNYTLKDDSQWEKKECKWLNDKKLDSKTTYLDIVLGEDNKAYAKYHIVENEQKSEPTQIIYSEDGINGKVVNIPEISKKDSNGFYPFIKNIRVLANGNIIATGFSKITVYKQETGDIILEFATQDGKIDTHENLIYHYNTQGNSIELFDGTTGQQLKNYPITLKEPYGASLYANEDKSIALYSNEGIQVVKDGSDLWELTADNNSGTIGSPKYYCNSFVTGVQDDYYVLYKSMNETVKLSHYIYDKDTPLEPDTTLIVFALKDNSIIRQAASEFQSANPNVKIDFQVAASEDASANNDDYIRTLNTELLAGKGPDIIILDDLPEKSYIEKGVLKDIDNIIKPLVSSGQFLPNIAEAYTVDGEIYTVPTKIGIPMAFGEKELTSFSGDLSKIAKYMTENTDKTVFGTIDQKAMMSFYVDALNQKLFNGNGNLDMVQMKSLLESLKIIMDNSKLSDIENNVWPSTEWRLIEDGNLLFLQNITGFYQSQSYFSTISQINASFSQINQSFIPIGKIGINNASENIEIAEQFVQTVFSSEIQETDYYDGFPVNKQVLLEYENIERTSADAYGGSLQGIDGKIYEMSIKWPVKDQRQEIIKICESAVKEAGIDIKLKEIILNKSVDYFADKKSLDETIESISQATKAYLTE